MTAKWWLIVRVLLLAVAVVLVSWESIVQAQENSRELIVITHDSFAVSEVVLQQFEESTGITVRLLRSGDTGMMVNQSILSKANPLGDVMYGVDNTFLSRALKADLFISYESNLLEHVPEQFKLDEDFHVTPIDYGDVCINYDAAYFEEHEIPVPQTLQELTLPIYEGMLVVENPAISSPGLAFLMTTIGQFGDRHGEDENSSYTWQDFWQDLVANNVLVVDDWTSAYYGHFSASSDGDRPLVVSYASSPAAEVFFAEPTPDVAPTASIISPASCFRQVEFAGILRETDQVEAAQQFIDFMLSESFQEDLPLQMFVFPVLESAELPEVFEKHVVVPEEPVQLDIAEIDEMRETWIKTWTEIVLR